MQKLAFIFSFLFVLFSPIIYADNASTTENQITNYINTHQPEQILLLKKLVNINSPTTNIAGVHTTGEILRPLFKQLGFKTYWVEEPANMHRAGTLIAERTGTSEKKIVLIGHLDTVFPANNTSYYSAQPNNTAKGSGVIDAKGGSTVIVYALKALQNSGALNNTTIRIILTGDEEASGKPSSISRKPLIDAAKQSDVALDFECALALDTATIARRGITNWKIQTTGTEAHSSEITQPPAGYGAIYELARILNSLRTDVMTEKYLSINSGLILGGSNLSYSSDKFNGEASGKENIIPKTAMATGDLRFMTADQKIDAEKKITKIIDQHLLSSTAVITYEDGIPSMSPTNNNMALLKKYSEISQKLGYGEVKPLDPSVRGAGDISYAASYVSASLAGLGPVGTGAHSEQETIDLNSLPIQTQRAAILIYQLTRN